MFAVFTFAVQLLLEHHVRCHTISGESLGVTQLTLGRGMGQVLTIVVVGSICIGSAIAIAISRIVTAVPSAKPTSIAAAEGGCRGGLSVWHIILILRIAPDNLLQLTHACMTCGHEYESLSIADMSSQHHQMPQRLLAGMAWAYRM